MRLYFATDIHGSEICWRKFLNSATHYNADALILGGDITGKALVPVIHDGGDRWHGTLQEQRRDFVGEDQVAAFELEVGRRGYYPFRTTSEELAALENDEAALTKLFDDKMLGTLRRWTQMADTKLSGTGVKIVVSPGNDDRFDVDAVLAEATSIELGEGAVVEVGQFQVCSTGWANRTPWNTYREEDEDVLLKRLRRMTSQTTNPPDRVIFNFHCPPYASTLDDAPGVNPDLSPKHGGHAPEPVGSTAVRHAIEESQPALTLHGHIHESRGHTRIGKTLCINPGSSYEQGTLLGALIEIDQKKVRNFVLTSG